ncbi:hypothetical protein COEREDRAFT_84401 [Coemansia reversa NRRL 1564]|uniref:Uncharacterized protein n=1 Tax=Coemansia reversa (strain ATCC 12441 / NRRL 1564) TaxID=763665 RepID=A0A2G5BLB7_COERN|nr:hypothetical protein COEREDRAFT_84401 [Coemansia reversa NRRL 1564]|eukprot:PIA19796.1 hypothetical protein COEREDRAFT_84401 [Coemansia reversa NRRL 1564]
MQLEFHEQLLSEARKECIRAALEEYVSQLENNYSGNFTNEVMSIILLNNGTESDVHDFIEEFNEREAELNATEEYGHRCRFTFFDFSNTFINSRADVTLYSLIDMFIEYPNNERAKESGNVSVNDDYHQAFNEHTTLAELGLDEDGEEELTFLFSS